LYFHHGLLGAHIPDGAASKLMHHLQVAASGERNA
jgi:hypothetical protein